MNNQLTPRRERLLRGPAHLCAPLPPPRAGGHHCHPIPLPGDTVPSPLPGQPRRQRLARSIAAGSSPAAAAGHPPSGPRSPPRAPSLPAANGPRGSVSPAGRDTALPGRKIGTERSRESRERGGQRRRGRGAGPVRVPVRSVGAAPLPERLGAGESRKGGKEGKRKEGQTGDQNHPPAGLNPPHPTIAVLTARGRPRTTGRHGRASPHSHHPFPVPAWLHREHPRRSGGVFHEFPPRSAHRHKKKKQNTTTTKNPNQLQT